MELVIKLKNTKKGLYPKEGDIIMYDQKEKIWYVTNKKDLFEELETRINQKLDELQKLVDENQREKREMIKSLNDFKSEVTSKNKEFQDELSLDIKNVLDLVYNLEGGK